MGRFTVQIVGKERLRTRATKVRKAVAQGVQDALLRGALLIEGDAKRATPVETGRLRASIAHRLFRDGQAVGYEVGTNVEYAPFVEFGTGRRGASSALTASAREGMREERYVHGPSAGMSAQPFLFPAFETRRPDIIKAIEDLVKKAIEAP